MTAPPVTLPQQPDTSEDYLAEYRRSQSSGVRVSGGGSSGDLLDEYHASLPKPAAPLSLPPVVVSTPQIRSAPPIIARAPANLPPAAAPDVTQVGAPPNPQARQLTGPAKFASDVFSAAATPFERPAETLVGTVTAPARAAAELATAAEDARAGRAVLTPPKQLALDAAQVGSLALAGPAEEAIGRVAAPLVGSRVAGAVSRIVPGAAIGAAYNPEHPAVGATVGGLLGAAANEANPARPTVPRAITRNPDVMLPDETTPRSATATGRLLEEPPTARLPEEPDYLVEYEQQHGEAPGEQQPAEAATPAATPPATAEPLAGDDAQAVIAQLKQSGFASGNGAATVEVPQGQHINGADDTVSVMRRAIGQVGQQQFQQAADAEIARRGVESDVTGQQAAIEETARKIVAGSAPPDDLLNEYQRSEIGQRARVNNATEAAAERAQFPITVDRLLDHAEVKGNTIAESADVLRRAGYTVPPALERAAVKEQMRRAPVEVPADIPSSAPTVHAMATSAPPRVGPQPAPAPPSAAPGAATSAPPTATAPSTPVAAARQVGAVGGALRAAFAPASVSPESARAAGIIREQSGRMAQDHEQAVEALKGFRKSFQKASPAENLDFIDRMERGQPQPSPELTKAATTLRQLLDDARGQVQALGTGKLQHFLENYFPHIWDDPSKAQNLVRRIIGKRPLEGTKSFLKQRSIEYTKDGIAKGLTPVSDNPVDLTLLKLREMQRYIMAQRILKQMKAAGLLKYVRAFDQPPEGYGRVRDNIAIVHGPPHVVFMEAYDALVMSQLKEVIQHLPGLTYERTSTLGKGHMAGALGYAVSSGDYMAAKYATPEGVVMHELGHILDFRYKLYPRLAKGAGAKELAALAKLRYEGKQPDAKFEAYVQTPEEQIANAVHALLYAPEKMEAAAPTVKQRLTAFLAATQELRPLLRIKPSLVLESSEAQVPVGGKVIRGEYWAPHDVARVLNNYLSPGLRGNAIYDSYMLVGNALNQAQLGLSAFHLGFTSVDAAVSQVAVALQNLAAGRVSVGAKQLATAPGAPLTTLLRGDKLLKAYLGSGQASPEFAKMAEAVAKAGGRVRLDSMYRTGALDQFLHALRNRRVIGAIARAPAAILDAASRPILEYIVPRQKLGVFMQLAEHELATLPKGAPPAQVRAALQRAWDSVDNRLGQMVYDNLFWNKVGKDLAHATVRSVGWNIGTFRELGGGAADLAQIFRDAAHGKQGEFTSRAAYLLALPFALGIMGAVATYLMTGRGPRNLKDYYYPPTGTKDPDGNENRWEFPSYMKDIFAYHRHPVETVAHKANPIISEIADMLQNKDYYGDEIRNPDDPLTQQAAQLGHYLANAFTPFGVRNVTESKKQEAGTAAKVVGFAGVTAAPREVVRSDAQNLMQQYLARRGHMSRTPEEQAAGAQRSQMLTGLREGTAERSEVRGAVQAGAMTKGQAAHMVHAAKQPALLTKFLQLTAAEAQKVYDLGTPEEQALWKRALARKLRRDRANRHVGASP